MPASQLYLVLSSRLATMKLDSMYDFNWAETVDLS